MVPLPDVSEIPSVELLLMPPLRRVFLLSGDQRYVVQLQDTRFNLNWRRVEAGDTYPRFGPVFAKFQKAWGAFSEFAEVANLGHLIPNRYELTYVNHLEMKADSFSRELEAKVKRFKWEGIGAAFLPPPASASSAWTFQMPDSVRREIRIKPNIVPLDDGSLRFEWVLGDEELFFTVLGKSIEAQRWHPLAAVESETYGIILPSQAEHELE
jgi:uncharacterized protein (TIGR04255 family)